MAFELTITYPDGTIAVGTAENLAHAMRMFGTWDNGWEDARRHACGRLFASDYDLNRIISHAASHAVRGAS